MMEFSAPYSFEILAHQPSPVLICLEAILLPVVYTYKPTYFWLFLGSAEIQFISMELSDSRKMSVFAGYLRMSSLINRVAYNHCSGN